MEASSSGEGADIPKPGKKRGRPRSHTKLISVRLPETVHTEITRISLETGLALGETALHLSLLGQALYDQQSPGSQVIIRRSDGSEREILLISPVLSFKPPEK